ncbi:MAG: ATP-binding cassette domain-containing protein [Mycoplasmataceae bacterium]|nr:ATP-binding cassette domain-containing protein [Mycoplasmataceae bacterium]
MAKVKKDVSASKIDTNTKIRDLKHPSEILQKKIIKTQDQPILSIKNLKKNYGKVEVLTGITFDMYEGERVAIVGANGAGKTTLSEIIAKVKDPSSGEINYSFGKTKSEISAKVGIQFQDSSYPDFYRVGDLVTFVIDVSETNLTIEEIDTLYKTFDLHNLKKEVANGLSGGQQQRLNIMLAVVNNPKLLILDEVGTGLDVESRTKIKAYINDYINETGAALLLVSHNSDEVIELVNRVITIHNGKIYEDRPLKEILAEFKEFDLYMNYLYLDVFKKNLDLRANKSGRSNSEATPLPKEPSNEKVKKFSIKNFIDNVKSRLNIGAGKDQ